MKILMVEPGKYARIEESDDINAAISRTIGGASINRTPFEQDKDICLVMGAVQKKHAHAINRIIETPDERFPVFGSFVVCRKQNGNYVGLTDEQSQKYNEQFHLPQKTFYDSLLDINFFTDYDPAEEQKAAKGYGKKER